MNDENERITSACLHLHNCSSDLNTINIQNPKFSETDIKLVLLFIDCMQIALYELKDEFGKLNAVIQND